MNLIFKVGVVRAALLATLLLACEAGLANEKYQEYKDRRQVAKDAYTYVMNNDLQRILVDNDPNILRYGSCADLMDLGSKVVGIFNDSYYINYAGIYGILEYIVIQAVEGVCREALEEIHDTYGLIADVIPVGEYIYDRAGDGNLGIIGGD